MPAGQPLEEVAGDQGEKQEDGGEGGRQQRVDQALAHHHPDVEELVAQDGIADGEGVEGRDDVAPLGIGWRWKVDDAGSPAENDGATQAHADAHEEHHSLLPDQR